MTESRILDIWPLPVAVTDLAAATARLRCAHPDLHLSVTQIGQNLLCYSPGTHDATRCWCHHCTDLIRHQLIEQTGDRLAHLTQLMIVCPDCGNKRCPHASHHDHRCSGSNEPGQAGSVYDTHPASGAGA